MFLSSASSPSRRRLLLGLVLLSLALAVACGGGDKKKVQTSDTTASAEEPRAIEGTIVPVPTEAVAVATPEFPAPDENAQIARLVIPAAKINANVQVKGVNARNEMENPDGKDNVAWYNFTTKPGFGSNAVFSGHVDWFTGEQGVFWYLRDLKEGDEVVVKLSDGTELKYRVTENKTYKSDSAPVTEIIGPTSKDAVTLITCDGTFDRRSQDYSNRRVVRAERVA